MDIVSGMIETVIALPTYAKIILGILLFLIFYSIIKRLLKIALMLSAFVLIVIYILKLLVNP